MNMINAQKEIFNAIARRDRVCFFHMDDSIFVTADGHMGYVFPKTDIFFNVNHMTEIDPLPIADVVKPENELFLTYDYRAEGYGGKNMFRRMKAPGKNLFVNNKFLKNFNDARFYQERRNKLSFIAVVEKNRWNDEEKIVGIILPLRADEWENEYRKEGDI